MSIPPQPHVRQSSRDVVFKLIFVVKTILIIVVIIVVIVRFLEFEHAWWWMVTSSSWMLSLWCEPEITARGLTEATSWRHTIVVFVIVEIVEHHSRREWAWPWSCE
jgi:hypothetical protein